MGTQLIRLALASAIVLAASIRAEACPTCRPKVNEAVYTPKFGRTLVLILSPLGLMAGIAFGVGNLDRPVVRKESRGR